MERVLSVEEKIRRAEERYEKRKNQNYRNTTATVNIADNNRDFKILKKMIIQILICLLIYFIFYLIQTTNYVFSASAINKAKEILDYDMDMQGLYTEIKNNFKSNENTITNSDEIQETNNEKTSNTLIKEEDNETQNNEIDNQEVIIEEENNEEENTDEGNINNSIEDEETTLAQEILNNYSIIKPASGFISSEFGTREEEGDIVTSYHNGIDIAIVTGTDVMSAIDGEVILSTESDSYGKYIKIKNGDLVTLYAHCSQLNVKVGDKIKQGDIIAKSGSSGKVTGPHLHFEIIYKDNYINPREVLEF